MKKQTLFGILAMLMLDITLVLPSFAIDNTITDSDINYWVKDALCHDERTDSTNIVVNTTEGIITLSGEVHTLYQKSHARDVTSRVKGVKKVVNRIAVHRSSWKSDDELANEIKNRLKLNWITCVVSDNIDVSVKKGSATLTGDVDTWLERREAGRVAFFIEDIWDVDNRITVKGHEYPWDEWHKKGPYKTDPYYYYFDPFDPLYDYYDYL